MANREPETMLGNIRKTMTGDGRKNPTLENMLGLEPKRRKGNSIK